ncbi:Fanconi anemia group I protein [Anabrus simplex]|uniref:Fanconi anemia group I protein n=1 Tax=Anabrus simplex TaxID=316456 RepID=UPI0035A34006
MKSFEEAIVSLGQKRNVKELGALVEKRDVEELSRLIIRKISIPDGTQLLHYVFAGLSDSGPSQMKRLKIIEQVLKELQNRELSIGQLNALVSRICIEVDNLSSVHLVRLTEWCIDNIQKGEGHQMCWKDLLPKLLSNLEVMNKVEHSGTEMTGLEYKSRVISSLCMAKWKPAVVTSLAGMFVDITLSSDERLQVVHKLCRSMDVMDVTAIPPFIKQLLHLCKNELGLPLFLQLQQYFTAKLYTQTASSADTLAIDSDSGGLAEIQRTESTVLFFINQSASLGHSSVKEFMKSLRTVNTAPEMVINPFFLCVLLSISCVPSYEEQVFEIIKSTLIRLVTEGEKRSRSAWIRNITPIAPDVEGILSNIVDNSGCEREMVKVGLVNLGFVLLGVPAMRGRESVTDKVWSYGRLILVKLVKKQPDVASTVLQTLANRIILGRGVTQYTDCLLKLSHTVPLLMNECQNILIGLLEQLLQLPGSVAQEIVRSLLPLMPTFPALRDALIMILRKALYRCNVETRQMAVTGFLLLLKTLDVKNLGAISQCSQGNSSGNSYSSQVHSQVNESSEAISLELLYVLRRCFVQQVEVRHSFYHGLYDAICKNPSLYPLVLNLLLEHFNQFYNAGEDTLPPLDFKKIVIMKDTEATLQEPLALLVFVLQQIVTKAHNVESSSTSNKSLNSLESILESLTKRMIKCTLEDFGLDNTVNLSDTLPESQQMLEMYKQMLGVYEALMSYCVATWTRDTPDHYQRLVDLFKGYSKLLEFSKLSSKGNKKAEADGPATQGQKKKKGDTSGKGRPPALKLVTILDLKTIIRMLQLLYQRPLEWASTDSANMLRGRREFSRYVMQATLQQLHHIKSMKSTEIKHFPALFSHCTEVGSVLYQNCIENLQDLSAVDKLTSVLSVECFYELLLVVKLHFKSQFSRFLDTVVEVSREDGLPAQLLKVIEKFQSLLEDNVTADEEDEDEPGVKKLPVLLVNVLSLLSLEISHDTLSVDVYNWMKRFAKEKSLSNPNLVRAVVSLLFKLQTHYKTDGVLFDNFAAQLLSVMGAIDTDSAPDDVTHYAILGENTANICLQQLSSSLKTLLDDVEWIVARLRGEFAAQSYPSEHDIEKRREFLKGKERDTCRFLGHCVKIITVVISIALPPGPTTDAVLKLLISLYATLSSTTKYFISRSNKTDRAFQTARFMNVVHLAGVDLAGHVQLLILHIMSLDTENEEPEKKKKKKGGEKAAMSKVLKDTKCVPKIVFGMETFEKFLIQLSNKCKVNLMQNIKPSTSRDFRIKMEVLQQALVPDDENGSDESNAEDNIDENTADNSHSSQPPAKRQRTS